MTRRIAIAAALALAVAASPSLAQETPAPADAPAAAEDAPPAADAEAAPQAEQTEEPPAPAITSADTVAVLRVLDKVTGRVSTIDAPMRTPVFFGTLEITPHACYKTPPEEPPEAAAFLEIAEVKADEPRQVRFTGWMFASSPALSALEHPVYDVWVLDCKSLSSAPSGNSE